MPRIDRDGDVAVLNIGDDENRFTVDWLAAMHRCLDEVEAMQSPVALVTVADGKFWSNGLDLDWLTTHLDQAGEYVATVHINIPFSVGMDALLRAKLPPAIALEAMTTGRRYGGEDALAAGIVTAAVGGDEVREAALAIARPLAGKAGRTLATIKERMFAEPAARLAEVEGLAVGS